MKWDWIHKYQVFLFDFDGLLVNTEYLHCEAYHRMIADRGYELGWDFQKFCMVAHLSASGLKETIYQEIPDLEKEEPRWEILYEEKKKIYMDLLEKGALTLLPGVEEFLTLLEKEKIKRAVVTNSTKAQVELIKNALPYLKTIPHWITREDYNNPKPSPEGYQIALSRVAKPGDKVIGFEDSLRGLQSLLLAGVKAVLICPADHPQLQLDEMPKVPRYSSFLEMADFPP